MAKERHISYSHRRTCPAMSSYDHDEISLTIQDLSNPALKRASAVKTLPTAKHTRPGFYFDFRLMDDDATFAKVTRAFIDAKIPKIEDYEKLSDLKPKPFAEYEVILVKIRAIQAEYLACIGLCSKGDSGPVVVDLPSSDLSTPPKLNMSALDELLVLHQKYLISSDQLPASDLVNQTVKPITLDEIRTACDRIVHHTSPGPNGMPLELFQFSESACIILCRLANYLLKFPDLVTKEFLASRIASDNTNGIPARHKQIVQYNIEYRIIADILALRLSQALSKAISPEQSAVLPGRCVGDTINMVLMAQNHLVETALDTFITPRLQHLFRFTPVIPSADLNATGRLKDYIRGRFRLLPDAGDESALKSCTGKYSFVDFDYTYYAVQLEQVHVVAMHFQRLAHPSHDGQAAPAAPTWAKLMLYCWHAGILSRSYSRIPRPFKSMDIKTLGLFFFEPFLQSEPRRHGRVQETAWAPVWAARFKALFSNLAQKGFEVRIVQPADNAQALSMPFFGTSLWSPKIQDWYVLTAAIENGMTLPDRPFTVADLPQLTVAMRAIEYTPAQERNSAARDDLVQQLDKIYQGAANHDELMSMMSRFDVVPASHHLAYGHPSHPDSYIPFTEWHNAPAMRAKLALLPKIPKTIHAAETRRIRTPCNAPGSPMTTAVSKKRKRAN
ncbi:hypothetical protein GGI09_004312 [Coemansia sp. S100]|nr:hypothetical protein GGI09_004312 [Coemansia sp. S100]KAJ2109058.1 hypothetical protein GGI16_000886 [Coemansia sp. S142-1]